MMRCCTLQDMGRTNIKFPVYAILNVPSDLSYFLSKSESTSFCWAINDLSSLVLEQNVTHSSSELFLSFP